MNHNIYGYAPEERFDMFDFGIRKVHLTVTKYPIIAIKEGYEHIPYSTVLFREHTTIVGFRVYMDWRIEVGNPGIGVLGSVEIGGGNFILRVDDTLPLDPGVYLTTPGISAEITIKRESV